jgi:hypothetical protein
MDFGWQYHHITSQYSTAQHSTAHHSTAQHSTSHICNSLIGITSGPDRTSKFERVRQGGQGREQCLDLIRLSLLRVRHGDLRTTKRPGSAANAEIKTGKITAD